MSGRGAFRPTLALVALSALAGAAAAAAAFALGPRWAAPIVAAALALAALAALGLSRRIERALRRLASRARGGRVRDEDGAFAAGEMPPYDPPYDPPYEQPYDPSPVLVPLSRAIDEAAREGDSRIRRAEAGRADLEAILDAMGEAVLALDTELRIGLANPAAAALFGLGSPAAAKGRDLLAATRSTILHAAARDCLETGRQREAELSLFLPGERSFIALAAPLEPPSPGPGDGESAGRGVVLVLNDVTELRRLERVRRDFVANVSHELRTPVQLVKGFAEALREGALGDEAKADRFLGIIERNAARMEALIADLLALASLEGEGRGWIEAEESPIAPILKAAAEAVGAKAEAKGMSIGVRAEEALSARVNAGLLEQAVVNLVENAVKYSPPGSSVAVTAARGDDGFLRVEVKDQGIGIPARDLGRIFERFYRVDRARSRELGGTGLGLAIVRHIALAHGGSASVESWEGEGSTFILKLPMAGPPSTTQAPDSPRTETV